ncbi:YafY family protein [Ferrovibrio sp.]|uniref:helix-turn-helix transcriptional regulator n=1 Tax=Ferrovibrio sp. TaxID=1917215 RepID=UPI00261D62CC|nr:YafY family protein [Ferrovibrio sp.]
MRKADRLFQIVQILRRARRHPVTAEALAQELETSKRSVYRDIAALMAQRVPIRGEAGMGYVLDQGFDLPPLMLTPDEIEAAVLGAQWVSRRADPVLARAALDLIAKIAQAVPERLRPYAAEPAAIAPPSWNQQPDAIDMVQTRQAIRTGRKIALDYRDELGRETRRVIWPVTIGYFDTVRMVVAWCELRRDFRSFRTDRVLAADFLDERYPERPSALRAKWHKAVLRNRGHVE